jgi:hypothetical protein
MVKHPLERVQLRVLYRGSGPFKWSGGPRDFGVQNKANALHLGEVDADGTVKFDLSVEVKPEDGGAPVFVGPLAHGSPDARFLYLSWRNLQGEYAQRFKLPLGSMTWNDIRAAWRMDQPLVGELIDRQPKATSTGANIGGSRAILWTPSA